MGDTFRILTLRLLCLQKTIERIHIDPHRQPAQSDFRIDDKYAKPDGRRVDNNFDLGRRHIGGESPVGKTVAVPSRWREQGGITKVLAQ